MCCYGDDETAIFFYFDISCIPYFIYKMRIDKKKKRKESRNNTITPPFPKIDLIMDHTLKIFGQPCPYGKKKIRVNGL